MQRFYFNISLGKEVILDDKDFFHQISHVLRSRINDEIILFNGDGFEYLYGISEITKKGIKIKFIEKYENIADSKLILNLYQAIPNKYEKIEYIIQKGTEIGINKFIFFSSERSQKLVINNKKTERFDFIIKEALEQCGGNKMPEIIFTDKLDFSIIEGEKFICHTNTSTVEIKQCLISTDHIINLFIGPEGGFSDKEINEFIKNECKLINFGNRIFRTETTGIVAGFYLLNK